MFETPIPVLETLRGANPVVRAARELVCVAATLLDYTMYGSSATGIDLAAVPLAA